MWREGFVVASSPDSYRRPDGSSHRRQSRGGFGGSTGENYTLLLLLGSCFSLYPVQVPGTELRLSGLPAGTST